MVKSATSKNYESDIESDEDVSPMNVSINIKCSFDPNSPSGVRCRIVHDPEDITDAIKRARISDESEDDSDEEEIEVQTIKKKSFKPKPKKPVDDENDESDDLGEGYDSHPELDDSEDLDEDDLDPDDGETVLSCIQKSMVKRR